MMDHRTSRRAALAGVLIGIGMGGFVDGIVFHQILQWHNLLSNRIPPTTMEAMRLNMLWDGIFHAFVWIVTLAGVILLWSAAHRRESIPSLPGFLGRLLLGWGGFNLVEGLINHQLLSIHNVREVTEPTPYNLAFLGVGGVLLLLLGWLLSRRGETEIE